MLDMTATMTIQLVSHEAAAAANKNLDQCSRRFDVGLKFLSGRTLEVRGHLPNLFDATDWIIGSFDSKSGSLDFFAGIPHQYVAHTQRIVSTLQNDTRTTIRIIESQKHRNCYSIKIVGSLRSIQDAHAAIFSSHSAKPENSRRSRSPPRSHRPERSTRSRSPLQNAPRENALPLASNSLAHRTHHSGSELQHSSQIEKKEIEAMKQIEIFSSSSSSRAPPAIQFPVDAEIGFFHQNDDQFYAPNHSSRSQFTVLKSSGQIAFHVPETDHEHAPLSGSTLRSDESSNVWAAEVFLDDSADSMNGWGTSETRRTYRVSIDQTSTISASALTAATHDDPTHIKCDATSESSVDLRNKLTSPKSSDHDSGPTPANAVVPDFVVAMLKDLRALVKKSGLVVEGHSYINGGTFGILLNSGNSNAMRIRDHFRIKADGGKYPFRSVLNCMEQAGWVVTLHKDTTLFVRPDPGSFALRTGITAPIVVHNPVVAANVSKPSLPNIPRLYEDVIPAQCIRFINAVQDLVCKIDRFGSIKVSDIESTVACTVHIPSISKFFDVPVGSKPIVTALVEHGWFVTRMSASSKSEISNSSALLVKSPSAQCKQFLRALWDLTCRHAASISATPTDIFVPISLVTQDSQCAAALPDLAAFLFGHKEATKKSVLELIVRARDTALVILSGDENDSSTLSIRPVHFHFLVPNPHPETMSFKSHSGILNRMQQVPKVDSSILPESCSSVLPSVLSTVESDVSDHNSSNPVAVADLRAKLIQRMKDKAHLACSSSTSDVSDVTMEIDTPDASPSARATVHSQDENQGGIIKLCSSPRIKYEAGESFNAVVQGPPVSAELGRVSPSAISHSVAKSKSGNFKPSTKLTSVEAKADLVLESGSSATPLEIDRRFADLGQPISSKVVHDSSSQTESFGVGFHNQHCISDESRLQRLSDFLQNLLATVVMAAQPALVSQLDDAVRLQLARRAARNKVWIEWEYEQSIGTSFESFLSCSTRWRKWSALMCAYAIKQAEGTLPPPLPALPSVQVHVAKNA